MCGGHGLRLKGNFGDTPKPLVSLQGKPLLCYIIEHYRRYGVHEFILLVGENEREFQAFARSFSGNGLTIDVLQTGSDTPTGGRIKRVEPILEGEERFFVTYGDGVSDIDIEALLARHRSSGKLVTLTAVRPTLPFGLVRLNEQNLVTSFVEKPVIDEWINAGFFVLERAALEHIQSDSDFENDVLPALSTRRDLVAYTHTGFWRSMDTYKDYLALDKLDLSDIWRSQ